jgi:excisionase family DNA binding protein
MTVPIRSTPLSSPAESALLCVSLRPREAAKAIGISERLLAQWTKARIVPHLRIGRTVLYPLDSLRSWLAQQIEAQQKGGSI